MPCIVPLNIGMGSVLHSKCIVCCYLVYMVLTGRVAYMIGMRNACRILYKKVKERDSLMDIGTNWRMRLK